MHSRQVKLFKVAAFLSTLSFAIVLAPAAYLGVTARIIKLCLTAQLPCLIIVQLIALRAIFFSEVMGLVALIRRFLYGWIIGIGLWHVTFVVYGAPVIDDVVSTACAAALSAILTTAPLACATGLNPLDWLACIWDDAQFSNPEVERFIKFGVVGVITGLSCSAAVIPLDWDRPWQEWPCPAVLGACSGYSGSMAVFAIVEIFSVMGRKDRLL